MLRYRRFFVIFLFVALLFSFSFPMQIISANPADAPVLLTVQAVNSSQVNLLWQDNSGGTNGFAVESKSGNNFYVIATLPEGTTSFSDTITSGEGTYLYRIRDTQTDSRSYEKSVAVMYAPGGLTATSSSGSQVILNWTDNSTFSSLYQIERKLSGGTFSHIQTVGEGSTTYTDPNVSPGNTYIYRIRKAIAADSYSSYSGEASVSTALGGLLAPSGLSTSLVTSSSITLTWTDNADNESGFRIERKAGTGSYSEIGTVGPNVTTFSNVNLSENTLYQYRVRAFNIGGNSPYSNEVSALTLQTVPVAPSALKATATAKDRVVLEWTNNANNASQLMIERKTGTGKYAQIATVSAGSTTYTDTKLTLNTTYTYRIRAHNNAGYSDYSNEANVRTPAGDLPAVPSNLRVTAVSKDSVTIAWADNSDNESGFKIERKTGTGNFSQIATVGANVTTFTNTKLSNNTAYVYRVRAYNTYGDSLYTAEVTITTGEIPEAPRNLAITNVTRNSVTISWTDHASNENGFRIERKTESGNYTQIATVGANTTTYTNSNLSANTTYHYRVRAYNATGNSAYSNEVSAVTSDQPAAPTNLRITSASGGTVALSWTDNSFNETGFKIERKSGTGNFIQIATVGANVNTYTNTALTANIHYQYRVRAYNAAGDSTYSNEVSTILAPISMVFTVGSTTYRENQQQRIMDAAPIIREGRTLLPFRYVAEAIGAEVKWDSVTKKITVTQDNKTIELWINRNIARVNGVEKYIDPDNRSITPIVIPPGRTMLPLRFIAENLGCDVAWNASTQQITVTY